MSPWAPNDFWPIIAAMVRLLQALHWVYGLTLSGKTQERTEEVTWLPIENRRPPPVPEKIKKSAAGVPLDLSALFYGWLPPPACSRF